MGMGYGLNITGGGSPSYNDPGDWDDDKEKDENESPEAPIFDAKVPWPVTALAIAFMLAILSAIGYVGYEIFLAN